MFPIIKDRKIKIAIIGCGRISNNHFGSLEKHATDFELVAICDDNPAIATEFSKKYNVPGYESYGKLLLECDCDVVSLCTPSGLHAA